MRKAFLMLLLLGVSVSAFAQTPALPDKPTAYEGQWIYVGEPLPIFPPNLVMVEQKEDGRGEWRVKAVDSCAYCGMPLTWKQAAFDKHASSMWALRAGLMVADLEITHHSPCFIAKTCREANPMLGQTRAQGYSVDAALLVIPWVIASWTRKGDAKYHIGGYRRWWILPVIGDVASGVGIITNLARWGK